MLKPCLIFSWLKYVIILPNLLDENGSERAFSIIMEPLVKDLEGLIGESQKGIIRFLKLFFSPVRAKLESLQTKILNEHTTHAEVEEIAKLLIDKKWGLNSDAGLPCLADPGAKLVNLARKNKVDIQAIPGPSSIFLAIMLSGLEAQSFAFLGYLPREKKELSKKIKLIERRSLEDNQLQVFIEAPYRNDKLLKTLLKELSPSTHLCIASNITAPTQAIISSTVAELEKEVPSKLR